MWWLVRRSSSFPRMQPNDDRSSGGNQRPAPRRPLDRDRRTQAIAETTSRDASHANVARARARRHARPAGSTSHSGARRSPATRRPRLRVPSRSDWRRQNRPARGNDALMDNPPLPQKAQRPVGCPQGLGQPAHATEGSTGRAGCPHSHRRYYCPHSPIQSTLTNCTKPGLRRTRDGPRVSATRLTRRRSMRSSRSCAWRETPRTAIAWNGLIVVLWRAGLRINEALSLTETDLEQRRGSILVRHGLCRIRHRPRYAEFLLVPSRCGHCCIRRAVGLGMLGIIRRLRRERDGSGARGFAIEWE